MILLIFCKLLLFIVGSASTKIVEVNRPNIDGLVFYPPYTADPLNPSAKPCARLPNGLDSSKVTFSANQCWGSVDGVYLATPKLSFLSTAIIPPSEDVVISSDQAGDDFRLLFTCSPTNPSNSTTSAGIYWWTLSSRNSISDDLYSNPAFMTWDFSGHLLFEPPPLLPSSGGKVTCRRFDSKTGVFAEVRSWKLRFEANLTATSTTPKSRQEISKSYSYSFQDCSQSLLTESTAISVVEFVASIDLDVPAICPRLAKRCKSSSSSNENVQDSLKQTSSISYTNAACTGLPGDARCKVQSFPPSCIKRLDQSFNGPNRVPVCSAIDPTKLPELTYRCSAPTEQLKSADKTATVKVTLKSGARFAGHAQFRTQSVQEGAPLSLSCNVDPSTPFSSPVLWEVFSLASMQFESLTSMFKSESIEVTGNATYGRFGITFNAVDETHQTSYRCIVQQANKTSSFPIYGYHIIKVQPKSTRCQCKHGGRCSAFFPAKCQCQVGWSGDDCGQQIQCAGFRSNDGTEVVYSVPMLDEIKTSTSPSPILLSSTTSNTVANRDIYPFGTVANIRCRLGFQLNRLGLPTAATCTRFGNWSVHLELCEVTKCSSLKIPLHGQIQLRVPGKPNPMTFEESWSLRVPSYVRATSPAGSISKLMCKSGYRLVGKNSTVCLPNGQWENQLGYCSEVACPLPKLPSNARITDKQIIPALTSGLSSKFRIGVQIRYECLEGYAFGAIPRVVTAITVKCLESGSWSKSMPNCMPMSAAQQTPPSPPPPPSTTTSISTTKMTTASTSTATKSTTKLITATSRNDTLQ